MYRTPAAGAHWRKEMMYYYHPMGATYDSTKEIESGMQIGS